jgi:hypothetical protein
LGTAIGGSSARTTGIWQPAWLEAAGESYFEKVRITPSNDGTVRFDAAIARYQPDAEFHAVIRSGKDAVSSGMVRADERRVALALLVNEPKLWSVNAPNLYEVTFELRHGSVVVDRVHSYFGFRSVSTGNGRVLINGRPTYLKMLLDQGYWPESTLTPPTDEAIQYDIRIAKEMGFNGVRKHQKLEDQRFLYWADKMGFYVSDEMANAFEFDEDYVSRFTAEWIQVVDRDYNHPSVIMWVPINESWGVPNLLDSRQQNHLKALYTLTKSLDATRPVVDNDGWGARRYHRPVRDPRLRAIGRHDLREVQGARHTRRPHSGQRAQGADSRVRVQRHAGVPFRVRRHRFIPPGCGTGHAWGYPRGEDARSGAGTLRGCKRPSRRSPPLPACHTQLTDGSRKITAC